MPTSPLTTSLPEPLPDRLLQDTASMFALLAAAVRLHVLWLLATGEQDVSTLAAATGHSVATVSHHLGKLRLAGLVAARRDGKRQLYIADDPHVIEVVRLAITYLPQRQQLPSRGRTRQA